MMARSSQQLRCEVCHGKGRVESARGGGRKKISGNGIQFLLRSQPPEGGGGLANFFHTHMTKNFTKQSRFKAKIVHVDLLTPSLH